MIHPSRSEFLKTELHRGYVYLTVIYWKSTGKWYGSQKIKLSLSAIEPLKFDREGLLEYIDAKQREMTPGAYKGFIVTITEEEYLEISEYNHFFTRLYPIVHPMENANGDV